LENQGQFPNPLKFDKKKKVIQMPHILERLRDTLRYGNVIEALLFQVKRVGISLELYYLTRQSLDRMQLVCPAQNQLEGITFDFLDASEMDSVAEVASWFSTREEWQHLLYRGKKCFGVKHSDRLIAFIWASFDDSMNYGGIELADNEVYTFAMCVCEQYRGRKLAEHMKYHCFSAMRSMGKESILGCTSFFNRSAIRSLTRLNASFLQLRFNISIFKRYQRDILVKRYQNK
jgi:hypothetical protein